MSKPTPGPWRWTGSEVVTADGETLLVNGVALPTGNHPKDSEATANAVAIATLPDLLAACEAMIDAAAPFMAEQLATVPECVALNCAVQVARLTVAKAKGGAL